MRSVSSLARPRPNGFTVIEMLIVVVVLALMGSLAAPSMGGYIDGTRTRGALNQIVADVGFARVLAAQEGRRTAVRLQSDGSYTVERLTDAGSWSVVRTVRLRDDYNGVVFSGGSTVLEFSSRGLMSNQSGDVNLTITRNGATSSAFVSPAGRVYRDY